MTENIKGKEVLLVDAQVLQTGAWDRGMGGYSLSLLEAYAKRQDHLPTTFILNKNLEFPEVRKEKLLRLFPGADFVSLDLPALPANIPAAIQRSKQTLNRYVREHHSGQHVHHLILALFMFDYCAAFPDGVKKILIFYDFIPLIRWRDFSSRYPGQLYFPHFKTILEADLLFAISETTKKQLETELSLPSEQVVNLNGARVKRKTATKEKDIIDLPKRFILMPSADLPHKNNLNAVKGFADFNREFGDDFTLVITSTFSEKTRQQLAAHCEKLLFTGNVSEGTLDYLYKKSEAVMLVSFTEGLGLPLLEAASYSKPVVCSAIPVFEEISKEGFYFCDPDSPTEITNALINALVKKDWAGKLEEYERIAKKYSWDVSAGIFVAGLQDIDVNEKARPGLHGGQSYNAVIPHPSTTSGNLGQSIQALSTAFLRQADVDFYVSSDNYIETGQKPYFLEYVAPASAVINCSPKVLRSRRTVYFLDETTASVDIALRALAFPSVCFAATKKLAPLLKALAEAGYIEKTIAKEWTSRHGREAMAKLLESAGNTVYYLADLPGYDTNDASGDNQQLAQELLAKF